MKLLPYPELPCFFEMTEVIRKNHIRCWQANDFWKKIQSEFNLEKTNANYQNVYRLLHRLVRDGFLIVDYQKNEMGCSTYSETSRIDEFKEKFCNNDESLIKVEKLCTHIKISIKHLTDELDAIKELKEELPEFSSEFDHLYTNKTIEFIKLKSKLKVLLQLIDSISKVQN